MRNGEKAELEDMIVKTMKLECRSHHRRLPCRAHTTLVSALQQVKCPALRWGSAGVRNDLIGRIRNPGCRLCRMRFGDATMNASIGELMQAAVPHAWEAGKCHDFLPQ